MSYNKKNIWKADVFDRIKININEEMKNSKAKLEKITESEEFIIYTYKGEDSLSYTYILGQSKKSPNKVFYLGKNMDHICIYKENLFMCNHGGELNTYSTFIYRINLKTKVERSYNLRDDHGKCIFIMGYGRVHTLDDYKKMEVINDELVIDCHRTKGDDTHAVKGQFNKDMDFKIIFRYINNDFEPCFIMDGREYNLVSNGREISDKELLRNKKQRKIVDKLDNFIAPFGFFMILAIVIGFIACIITKFSSILWNSILVIGIIGMVIDCIINKYVNNKKYIKRKK